MRKAVIFLLLLSLASLTIAQEASPDDLAQQVAQLTERLNASQARSAQLAEQRTSLEARLRMLRAELTAASGATEDLAQVQAQLQARNTRVAELAVRITDLESQLSSTMMTPAPAAEMDSEAIAALEAQLQVRNTRVAELAVRITDLESQQMAMQSLSDQVAQLQEENQALQLQLSQDTSTESAAAPATEGSTSYIVVEGDTLSDIAEAIYGNDGLWPLIAEANGIALEDAGAIAPGTLLVIPAQ